MERLTEYFGVPATHFAEVSEKPIASIYGITTSEEVVHRNATLAAMIKQQGDDFVITITRRKYTLQEMYGLLSLFEIAIYCANQQEQP